MVIYNLKNLNVGIVGCGGISNVHARSIIATKKCTIVSACDLSKEHAEAFAKKFGVPGVYTDFSEMLKKEKLDILHVLTPPQAHAALTVEALNAGVHCLVEKPFCMTVAEADKMIEARDKNKVTLGVIHSYIFTPAIREALKIVRAGEIGDILAVDTIFSLYSSLGYTRHPRWYYTLQGAYFGEFVPHGLYTQLAFMGKIKKIFGITRPFAKREISEPPELVPFSDLEIIMESDKCLGTLFMTSNIRSQHAIIQTRIVGSKEILIANIPFATVIRMKQTAPETLPLLNKKTGYIEKAMSNLGPAGQLISQTASLAGKALMGSIGYEMTHKTLVKEFVQSIEDGTAPPVTAEEGKDVVKATNMLWENIL